MGRTATPLYLTQILLEVKLQIILLERIEKLGQMGDVVNVRAGFARNFLLPQKKALRATQDNLDYFEREKSQLEGANLERRTEAERVGEKLEGLAVSIIRNAGDSGQLYGSVNSRDIADAVSKAGFTVARNQVLMERPLKMLGLHDYRIRLHPEVAVSITVNVAQSEEEAEKQKQLGQAIIPSESGEGGENEGANSFSTAEFLDEVPTSDTVEGDTSEELVANVPTEEPNT